MDANTEKLCLEELSHMICDADAKVTIKEVSTNWNVSLKDSETVMVKWSSNYKGDRQIRKEYLIRGKDLNGNCVISVVPERKLEALGKLCPNYCSSLFSLELQTEAGRRLNVSKIIESKFISLPLDSAKREIIVEDLPIPEIKKEFNSKPSTSTLLTSASTSKPTNKLFGAAQVKKEKTSPDAKPAKLVHTNGTSSTETVTVKQEKKTPVKKESPKKNKIASGRSAISSFFSTKPIVRQPLKSEPVEETKSSASLSTTIEIKKEMEEDDVKPTQLTNSKKKRTLSDSDVECIPSAPKEEGEQIRKKIKTEAAKVTTKKASQRARILQICDSSSDEEEPPKLTNGKSEASKLNVSDEDTAMVTKEKENTTPEKKNEQFETNGSVTDEAGPNKRRYKAKKMVKRTYEDEDGYINTVNEMVEYSCSEDESASQPMPSSQKGSKPEPTYSAAKPMEKGKKKVSPPTSKSQKSILTFFTKK